MEKFEKHKSVGYNRGNSGKKAKEACIMFQYKKTVPGDPTILPGMHTILADRGQSYQVNYIKDVEYVQRDGKPLHLQLLLPGGLLPGMESSFSRLSSSRGRESSNPRV